VIVYPTDTVYGLICNARSKIAVRRLFRIKKRSLEKAIPVFVQDVKMAKKFAHINKKQEEFLKKVWPGRVTCVLKAKKKFPQGVLEKDGTIGLRIPRHKALNQLILNSNLPLSATSANIAGKPASTKIKNIINQFNKEKFQPDLIINAGNLKPSKPSTVVDLTVKKLKILRRGAIKKKDLPQLL